MADLFARLLGRPERHYIPNASLPSRCACGFASPWDYDLRKHFEQTGRIGK